MHYFLCGLYSRLKPGKLLLPLIVRLRFDYLVILCGIYVRAGMKLLCTKVVKINEIIYSQGQQHHSVSMSYTHRAKLALPNLF